MGCVYSLLVKSKEKKLDKFQELNEIVIDPNVNKERKNSRYTLYCNV
jgi:hypothetical protein